MEYWLKIFLSGVFVGILLCMIFGYLLIMYDKRKENKSVIRESKKEQDSLQHKEKH